MFLIFFQVYILIGILIVLILSKTIESTINKAIRDNPSLFSQFSKDQLTLLIFLSYFMSGLLWPILIFNTFF